MLCIAHAHTLLLGVITEEDTLKTKQAAERAYLSCLRVLPPDPRTEEHACRLGQARIDRRPLLTPQELIIIVTILLPGLSTYATEYRHTCATFRRTQTYTV